MPIVCLVRHLERGEWGNNGCSVAISPCIGAGRCQQICAAGVFLRRWGGVWSDEWLSIPVLQYSAHLLWGMDDIMDNYVISLLLDGVQPELALWHEDTGRKPWEDGRALDSVVLQSEARQVVKKRI
ncbi:hypothetical protein Tco_1320484 [Tanacetum coccineum]